MKTITTQTTVYKFNELTEEQQREAIQSNYDINVNYGWWDFIYKDAKTVGIKIEGFDLGRGAYCNIEFIKDCQEVAKLIQKQHGETTETYKDAAQYLSEYSDLVKKYSDGVNIDRVAEENEYDFDSEADELETEFKRMIADDYKILLQQGYDYLTSEEAIEETLIDNDYDFTADGKIY